MLYFYTTTISFTNKNFPKPQVSFQARPPISITYSSLLFSESDDLGRAFYCCCDLQKSTPIPKTAVLLSLSIPYCLDQDILSPVLYSIRNHGWERNRGLESWTGDTVIELYILDYIRWIDITRGVPSVPKRNFKIIYRKGIFFFLIYI